MALKRSCGPHGPTRWVPGKVGGETRPSHGAILGRYITVSCRNVRLRLDAAACRLAVAAPLPSCRASASCRSPLRSPPLMRQAGQRTALRSPRPFFFFFSAWSRAGPMARPSGAGRSAVRPAPPVSGSLRCGGPAPTARPPASDSAPRGRPSPPRVRGTRRGGAPRPPPPPHRLGRSGPRRGRADGPWLAPAGCSRCGAGTG